MKDEYFVYLGSFICLITILYSFKFGKWFGLTNLLIYCTYSILLYYNLFFNSKGGTSLLWLFLFAFFGDTSGYNCCYLYRDTIS